MQNKLLEFLKKWLQNADDCCPIEKLNIFIINEFRDKDEQKDAENYIGKLINEKIIRSIERNGANYIMLTNVGVDFLNDKT